MLQFVAIPIYLLLAENLISKESRAFRFHIKPYVGLQFSQKRENKLNIQNC